MAFITYRFANGTREEVGVTEGFAAEYAEMEHKYALLIKRKETRRHLSFRCLSVSLCNAFRISSDNSLLSISSETFACGSGISNPCSKDLFSSGRRSP